jgi:serine/threonine protein kinase
MSLSKFQDIKSIGNKNNIHYIKSNINYNINSNNSESDSDGSVNSDNIEDLELEWVGILIQGEYVIIKYISRGTFSRVWLSYHFKSKQFYILKIYFEEFEDESKDEIKIYQKIENNSLKRNLTLVGTTSYKNKPILILPYLGMSLDEILSLKEKISYQEFKHLSKEILMGILELHQLNIIHNDIKIDNILTTYFTEEDKKFCKFIENLKIEKLYDICYNTYKPEGFQDLNKDKKKKFKKKIKPKINKLFSDKFLEIILKYQDSEDNSSELGNYNELSDNSSIEFEEDENEKLILIDLSKNDTENPKNDLHYINKTTEKQLINLDDLSEISLTNKLSTKCNKDDIKPNDEPNDEPNGELNSTQNNKHTIDIRNIAIKIIDYSNSEPINLINEEEEYQIRAFRSPENIMGNKYSFKSEIWAIGCLFWLILTDEYLFEPELIGKSITRDCYQLLLMEKYLGNIPNNIKFNCGKTFDLFTSKGNIKNIKNINNLDENNNKINSLENELREQRNDFSSEEINNICGLLKCMFCYNSKDRFNIKKCLNHSFFLL